MTPTPTEDPIEPCHWCARPADTLVFVEGDRETGYGDDELYACWACAETKGRPVRRNVEESEIDINDVPF